MAIALAQVATTHVNTPTSAITTQATGSTFVAVVSSPDPPATLPSDSYGNSWGSRVVHLNAGGARLSVYVVENGVGGAGHTFEIPGASPGDGTYASFAEVTGAATASLDTGATAQAIDAASPWTLSGSTLAQANEMVIACNLIYASGNPVVATATGYTKYAEEQDLNNFYAHTAAYKVVSATTAPDVTWSVTGATPDSVFIGIIALKEASGGGATTTTATAAAGVATVSGAGAATTLAAGSAAGSSTVSAAGASVAATAPTAAAGVATVSATGRSTAATSGQASGVATVSGAGASNAATSGQAAGAAMVSGAGSSTAAMTATPAAGTATVSAVGSSVAAGQTTAIPAQGVATVSAQGSSIAATTAVPAQGSSEVSATTPTSGGGGYDDTRRKIRKRVNELNKKILQAEAQEITEIAVTKAKSVLKSAPTEQGFDEDEEEALMLLL